MATMSEKLLTRKENHDEALSTSSSASDEVYNANDYDEMGSSVDTYDIVDVDDNDDDDVAVNDKSDEPASGKEQERAHENENQQDEDDDEDEEDEDSQQKHKQPALTDKQLFRKREFEKDRDEILDELPESVKNRFGQIYFSKWSGIFLPTLVLNPFHISPGPVRHHWCELFDKERAKHRLERIANLCYWYGGYKDPKNAYSFLSTNKLIPYDIGKTKGYHKLPKNIQLDIQNGKKVPMGYNLLITGLKEMKDDLKVEPYNRRGKMSTDFLEIYQLPSTDSEMDEDDDDDDDEIDDDDDDDQVNIVGKKKSSSSTVKRKTTTGGKKRRGRPRECKPDEDEEGEEEEEEAPASRTSMKRRKVQDTIQPTTKTTTTNVIISSRKHQFSKETWWMVDLDYYQNVQSNRSINDRNDDDDDDDDDDEDHHNEQEPQGATVLLVRCMDMYNWDEEYTERVLKSYRQFLDLKYEMEDWDGRRRRQRQLSKSSSSFSSFVLTPCVPVEQMWKCHVLDIHHYLHDMMLLYGRVFRYHPFKTVNNTTTTMTTTKNANTVTTRKNNKPNDRWKKNMKMTCIELEKKFGRHVDTELWMQCNEMKTDG